MPRQRRAFGVDPSICRHSKLLLDGEELHSVRVYFEMISFFCPLSTCLFPQWIFFVRVDTSDALITNERK